jgi:hypothetical protein
MLRIIIKVIPSSGKIGCILAKKSDELKCFVKSPPERGKANAELIKYLAKKLSVQQNSIKIIAGSQSRKKIIAIDADITHNQLMNALGIVKQQKLFE